MRRNEGMTLIECLVALSVATVLAMMLMSMMTHVLRSKKHSEHRKKNEEPMHDLAALLDQDIAAMIPRSVQWASGEWSQAISVGNQRWCWTSMRNLNPKALLCESSWYRVCYAHDGSRLLRYVWLPGDGRAHEASRVTHRWEGIHTVRVSWPVNTTDSKDHFFWPMLWSWDVVTDQGLWQSVHRVRASKESS